MGGSRQRWSLLNPHAFFPATWLIYSRCLCASLSWTLACLLACLSPASPRQIQFNSWRAHALQSWHVCVSRFCQNEITCPQASLCPNYSDNIEFGVTIAGGRRRCSMTGGEEKGRPDGAVGGGGSRSRARYGVIL
ncbi:hypothetical protein BRADI_3g58295v3 [Brachypodium distachyon]|uniref:Uncharacterized protein n=1 Tax=Brachypodium distachyon TaxID=15368 RepID=A0A0Q3INR2_BRADI|nr:hypothetical protein BRADI_3g58295v3 [Brachypodium distachyon]